METEEGRPLRFGIILLNREEAEREGLSIAQFKESRAISSHEIRRLAPATRLSSTFIAVEQRAEGSFIWGTVDAGSEWSLFQQGESSSGTGLPFNLVIIVSAPGTISLKFSDSLLVITEHGQLAVPGSNVFKFGPIHEFFRPVIVQLLSEAFPDRKSSHLDDHFTIAYGGYYLRFLARTLRFSEELAHGGTLIVLREADTSKIGTLLKIKYETVDLDVRPELLKNVKLLYDDIEFSKPLEQPDADRASFNRWRDIRNQLRKSDHRLADLSRFLARLTQVDGALVLTDQLRVLGFGAIVEDLSKAPSIVRNCRDECCQSFLDTRSDGFGTRHRSAMRLCQEADCVAFVLSQDGGVKALKGVAGQVLLWPSVSLGPSAWSVTPEDLIPELRERYLNRNMQEANHSLPQR